MAIGAGLRSIHSNMGSVALQGCWFLVGPHVKPSKFDCELPENKLINFHFATKTAKLATFLSVRSTQNGTIIRNSAAWFVNTPMISPFWLVILISFKNMLVTSTMPFAWSNHILETMDQPLNISIDRRKFGSQTSDNMERWKAVSREKSQKRKDQKKEDAGARKDRKVAKHCVFSWFCGSGGLKNRLAKAAGAETSGEMRDEKLHAVVARSTFGSKMC